MASATSEQMKLPGALVYTCTNNCISGIDENIEIMPKNQNGGVLISNALISSEPSCVDRCSSAIDPMFPCQCDDNCTARLDCCPDYMISCSGRFL